jgi:hypothetical protein
MRTESRKRGPKRSSRLRSQVMGAKTGYMATSSAYLSPPRNSGSAMTFSLRKEVIQPQVLLRLPCYDFTPIMSCTLEGCLLAVSTPASSTAHFRDVTGGVYKARERIHRGVLIRDY